MDKSVPLIRAPELWARGVTGKGILVGIGDTGFTSHGDLDSVIVKKIPYTDGSTKDGFGHGTACSSVIAGQAIRSSGKYKGVAPDAKIIMAKVLDDDGSGSYETIMNGMQALADAGVQIVNLSLGSDGPADGTDPLCLLMDRLTAERGIAFVCAAGNADGAAGSMMVGSPAVARSAIAVAACGKDKTIAEFSSRGPSADGREKPEVTAPGGKNAVTHWIVMARAPGTTMGIPISSDYIAAPGTSFASPHVAGLCALLKQAYPEASPEALREMLIKGAGGSVWKSDFGYGVVDAVKSVEGGNGDGGGEPEPPKLEVWIGASIDQGKNWYVITKIPVKLGAEAITLKARRFGALGRILTSSVFEIVQTVIALTVTFGYIGMLGYSLLNSFIPAYATSFNTLIDWGIVPGLIWGSYFATTAFKIYLRRYYATTTDAI